LPSLQSQWHHAHRAAIEELDAFHIRCPDQATIQRVGPAVILAAQHVFAAAAQGDWSGSMPAHVAEGTKRSLCITNHDDRLAHHVSGEKTFGIGDRTRGAIYFAARLI